MLEDNLTDLNKTTEKLRKNNQDLQQEVDTLKGEVKNCNNGDQNGNKTVSSGAMSIAMNFDLIPHLFFILNFLTHYN